MVCAFSEIIMKDYKELLVRIGYGEETLLILLWGACSIDAIEVAYPLNR
jgi:hypothetical protein